MRRRISSVSLIVACSVFVAGAYIVKKGDTLWDLSAQFRNDPFAWPDLWSQNRHIENPNVIYPGDSINVGEATAPPVADTVSKIEEAAGIIPSAPPPPDSMLPKGVLVSISGGSSRDSDFRRNLGTLPGQVDTSLVGSSLKDSTLFIFRKSAPPAVFNKYFQMLAPKLIDRKAMREDASWIKIANGDKMPSLLLHTGDEILIQTGRLATAIKAGSIVEIWMAEPITFKGSNDSVPREYALMRLGGFSKVESVGDTISRAIIIQSLAAVPIAKAKARLTQSVTPIKVSSYQAVDGLKFESMPQIKYAIDPTLAVAAYSYVIADGGTSNGLNPGDGVAFLENKIIDPTLPPRTLGRGIVVTAGANEACILVREMSNPSRRLDRGNRVALTHRAIIR